MSEPDCAHVICIVPKLGAGVAGGKINAVYTRMNLLADKAGTKVTLLNLQHGCNQKVAFAELVKAGLLDPRIEHQSINELCALPQTATSAPPPLPDWDATKDQQGSKSASPTSEMASQ